MVNALIRQGYFILLQDEQVVMNLLLIDHASLTGLRIKQLSRDDTIVVGGWQFHKCCQLMKDVRLRKVTPYIYYMSWTLNKVEKLEYLGQWGYLLVSDHCMGKKASAITQNSTSISCIRRQNLATACCVAESIVRCPFRDKPSKIPCNESPPKDKGQPLFL